jgi:hypothetical protein
MEGGVESPRGMGFRGDVSMKGMAVEGARFEVDCWSCCRGIAEAEGG